MEDQVKSFLSKIQELKEKKIKVDVISTKESVDSSPLNFKQQKNLISTIADGAVGSLKFQKFLNEILIENTGLETLKSCDRLPIILKLRMDSIGNILKIDGEEVDISPTLEKAKKMKFKYSKTIKGDLTIELEVPTLVSENSIIHATIECLKKDGDAEISKNVGNIYTFEILKYIKSVKFGELVLQFADVHIKDRVKIVDNLPVSLNKEIIAFIQDIKKKESEVLVVSVNGEEKSFDIDVSFFDS